MQGLVGLAALGVAALTLIVVELAQGARDYGELAVANPCTATVSVSGGARRDHPAVRPRRAQRRRLRARHDARGARALVRARAGCGHPWDQETIERAVRSGLLNSIDEAEDRGSIGGLSATVLRELTERAPLDLLSEGGGALADLLSQAGDAP